MAGISCAPPRASLVVLPRTLGGGMAPSARLQFCSTPTPKERGGKHRPSEIAGKTSSDIRQRSALATAKLVAIVVAARARDRPSPAGCADRACARPTTDDVRASRPHALRLAHRARPRSCEHHDAQSPGAVHDRYEACGAGIPAAFLRVHGGSPRIAEGAETRSSREPIAIAIRNTGLPQGSFDTPVAAVRLHAVRCLRERTLTWHRDRFLLTSFGY
jgi:hypothetical protein